eukprot:TRINITY_DN64808_c0_g1_i1.p1 TRINITY_DN64808_c0_g1~~TRINITY_DN64808_c0_g1_i1.p1  ORF type:complete len:212 (+),score=29.81 TRINITY_DN64808_c0_g1_i1:25-636(+)
MAAFALGEAARPSQEVVLAFSRALREEAAPHVEASLLQGLACLASRARSLQQEEICDQCVELVEPYLTQLPCNNYSLSGENALLVVLMAGGPHGAVKSTVLNSLQLILCHCCDPYMNCFAREVIRRHMLACPPPRRLEILQAEVPLAPGSPSGSEGQERRRRSRSQSSSGSRQGLPYADDRLISEKRSRLMPCENPVPVVLTG